MTALLKKRLKFVIFLSLILIQVKNTTTKLMSQLEYHPDHLPCDRGDRGNCGERGGLVWSLHLLLLLRGGALHPSCQTPLYLQGRLTSLVNKIRNIVFWQDYWKEHKKFYTKTLEEYCHPSGVPMNWDGRRYDVPNLGFKKVVVGVLLTIYGPIVVTLGSIIILLLKYLPIQLHALFRYLRLMTECSCAFLPFWLVGIPLVVGQWLPESKANLTNIFVKGLGRYSWC